MANYMKRSKSLQLAAAATGVGNAIPVWDAGTLTLQISGTFSATITFEVTQDGTNWISMEGVSMVDKSVATSTTTPGIWRFNVMGLDQFRANITARASGNVTAHARTYAGSFGAELN